MRFLRRHPILISVIILLFAIQLFSLAFEDKQVLNPFNRVVLNLTYYPQKFTFALSGEIVRLWDNYINLINTRKENLRLKAENQILLQENMQLWEAKLQNERLKKLLEYKGHSTYKVLSANVIAGSPSVLRSQVVIIDRGLQAGISEGMTVVTHEGIVGRVYLVGDKSSEVILITDPISAVDAYIHRNRARGIVKGTGNGCVMEYIDSKSDLSIGDKVISSGKDGFFPKGVLIGTVKDIEKKGSFLRAQVSPNVDLNSLEEVLVILKSPEKMAFNE